ncbi:MAG: Holliday junction resolvase RuvX [Flavobacteriales bacterium]|jgi:putative Holliday junction resolvase|nr:Holliday junction resolvase RuvX [Flavobacteriales bacterium]|tara:strand:+ start:11364 stop:11774 length:411 start_codon:yes stop_codon:yes gene_type:complete
MSRILAIDYGQKRIGLAHTDNNKIIASPLETVLTKDIFIYLSTYLNTEDVECIVVGEPKTLLNKPALLTDKIVLFVKQIKKLYNLPVHMVDERFTSKIAVKSMVYSNMRKKKRQNKSIVDKISATIILQSFLHRLK